MLTAERPAPQQNVKINSKLKLIALVYLHIVSAFLSDEKIVTVMLATL